MMISLPSKWIKESKLGKGDEINLDEKDRKLIISTEKSLVDKNKASINVSGLFPLVNRTLVANYIRGIDELEVTFSNFKEIEDFQKRAINELLGFEIIKQSQNSILVKDITGTENQEIDEIIKRIFLILDSMADELSIALEKKQNMKPIIEIDISVNKFVNFCLRILNKKGYKEFNKTSEIYAIVSMLEEIGDTYKRIAESNKKVKITENQVKIIRETRDFLKIFEKLFFNFNKDEAVKLAKKYEEIKKKIGNKNKIDFYLYELNETIIKMNNYLLVISV